MKLYDLTPKIRLKFVLVGLIPILSFAAFSALAVTDGTLDGTYTAVFDAPVNSVVVQPDGKMIVGGEFTSYNGTASARVARINADGSLDTTFNPGTGANATVYALALQTDGRIIIAGEFTNYNGTTVNRIGRLNADGTLDATFNTGTGFDSSIFTVKIQTDGKVLAGGFFSVYNGTARSNIARIKSDGSVDAAFNPGAGADGAVGTGYNNIVRSSAIQPDGKVLVGCDCSAYNGTPFAGINRLNTNGTLDTTFDSGNIINSSVLTIALQADGKILIGGNFTYVSNTNQNYQRLFRLNGTAAATAAGISVSGRVTTYNGRGVGRAQIILTEADGTTHSAISNSRGNFRIDEIAAGQTCVIAIQSKRFRFGEPTRVVYLTDNVSDLDFVALPERWDNVMPYKMLKIEHFEKAASRMNH